MHCATVHAICLDGQSDKSAGLSVMCSDVVRKYKKHYNTYKKF